MCSWIRKPTPPVYIFPSVVPHLNPAQRCFRLLLRVRCLLSLRPEPPQSLLLASQDLADVLHLGLGAFVRVLEGLAELYDAEHEQVDLLLRSDAAPCLPGLGERACVDGGAEQKQEHGGLHSRVAVGTAAVRVRL